MYRSYKYRIYPNKSQADLIDKTFSICRLVYNLALETKMTAWSSARKGVSYFDLCLQLTELKASYPWMHEVDSQSLQASLKNLENAYNGFFNGKGFPKFKSKKGHQSFKCPNNTRKIDWVKSTLSIPKIKNIPIKLSRKFKGSIKSVTVTKTTTGKYFATVLVESAEEKIQKPILVDRTTIGIDVGIKHLTVCSNGIIVDNNRYLINNTLRLKCLQRRASRKKKGSNNRKKANKRVAILHEKITNQRTDYIHNVTTKLIRDNQTDTFVIEDLNVKGMVKNRKLSRSMHDVSFGEFRRQMEYKCEWYGKNLIVIDRFAPSSKRCSDCGNINESLTLADREWTCLCGASHDRDINAAKNIKYFGLQQVLNKSPEGIGVEPAESRRLRRAKKQEFIPKGDINANTTDD